MRLLVSGGGTGGHIYPALALVRHLLKCEPRSEVLFVGTAAGLENKIIPAAGFPLATITARGYSRRLTALLPALGDFGRGFFQARKIIGDFKPEVVVGTGGYVSAPVVLAAVIGGIPAVIHEQNALPGMANRFLAPLVSRICLSFESSRNHFRSNRLVVTGNPRSSEAAAYRRDEGRKRFHLPSDQPLVLVFGGSRGALKINRVMTEYLLSGWWRPSVQLIYVTGEIYYNEVKEKLGVLPSNISLFPYLQEMPAALAAADLVITRSGATTLAELTGLGIPAILIPSPNVVNNHQYYNAQVMADCGAALLIEERNLTPYRLREELSTLLGKGGLLEKMGQAGRNLGVGDSADKLYRCLRSLTKQVNKGGG